MNRYNAIGRLTRDPELKDYGFKQTNFTVAVDRNYESKDGQTADFIPCVANNKLAENIAKYCRKGSLVAIEGRMKSRSYENKNKQTVSVVECAIDNIQFLYSKPKGTNSSKGTNTWDNANVAQNASNAQNTTFEEMYESIDEYEFNEEDIQF